MELRKCVPNILLVIVSTFLLSSSISAQTEVRIGIKGGISIPNLKSNSDNPVINGWSSIFAPYAGAVGEFKLSDNFSLQAELNYASQGGKKNGLQVLPTALFFQPPPPGIPDTVYATFASKVKLSYIELPVMFKGELPLNETASLFANAGPYIGYLIKAKSISSGSSKIYADANQTQPLIQQEVSFDENLDIKDQIKKFNAGLQFGVGISFNTGTGKLMLTAGGNLGLVPIQKDTNNGKNTTGSATVTIGYLFNLGQSAY